MRAEQLLNRKMRAESEAQQATDTHGAEGLTLTLTLTLTLNPKP